MQQPPPPQPPPGGAQYGVPPPDMSPFASPTSAPRPMQLHAEAASPINSRPPPQSFEELLPGGGAGGFPDDLGGDETDRGGASGNRWPRQETLALLKIRSDMDATFRDATLKGPLWEEVSRKLAELGYRRSAKKCKEKFENVHKYYKRTKENRAGRQDGKTYRFFSQLEALHASSPTTPTQSTVPTLPMASLPVPAQIAVSSPATIGFSAAMAGPGPSRVVAPVTPIEMPSQPLILRSIQDIGTSGPPPPPQGISGSTTPTTGAPTTAGISFSSNTESSESDESDDEDTEEIGGTQEQGKRKRQGGSGAGGSSSKKMMSFFEGLMKQVMERQEAMQQRFLETIEKREQDRMIREEAWRRQEMTRLNREQEILAQERAMAASRDAAVVSFIQRITGQSIPLPTIPAPVITVVPPPPPHHAVPVTTTQPQLHQLHQPHHPPQHSQSQPSPKTPRQQNPPPLLPQEGTPPAIPQPQPQPQVQPQPHTQPHQPPPQPQPTPPQPQQQLQLSVTSTEMVLSVPESREPGIGAGFEPGSSSTTPSRWPKAEVHALIKLRSGMDSKYQEAGPKGPLWEEISNGMQRMGYNRSSKRCKEKWENINKYFKKVKESNKKRPEDSKTCPYFHELDALYRNKYGSGTASGPGGGSSQFDPNSQDSLTFNRPPPPGQGPPLLQPQPQPISQQPPAGESDSKNSNGGGRENTNGNGTGGGIQITTSNGGATSTFYSEPSSMGLKKPEDIMKELMEHRHQRHDGYDNNDNDDEYDDDVYDDDDEDEDEDGDDDNEDGKMQYKIQFQRPNMNVNVGTGTGGGNPPTSTAPGTAPGSNSFLAMVK